MELRRLAPSGLALAVFVATRGAAGQPPAEGGAACPVCGPDAVGPGATGGLEFKSGHFTCLSCDAASCAGCDKVLCDVSQCVGQFGGDDTQGCQPWWWCSGDSPPGDNLGAYSGFLQNRARPGKSHSRQLQLHQASGASALQVSAASGAAARRETSTAEESGLSMKPSRFICTSAAMAPKVRNPRTMQMDEQNYIVFEKSSCKGSTMGTKCYCYDNYAYLGGEDPKTSELKCNPDCNEGMCDGRTCAHEPPPPLGGPPPFAAAKSMPAIRQSEEVMIPMIEATGGSVTAPPV
eukprot:TRINITY_DN12891_c0_g1_i1.p1 TRINITY_DN12891_c0_g1~~TRINITY_DN12891_c0_g1_i1.p1  ORF type:complete len:292 (+),score=59.05 TRINITY_DN12891_c0_g1_i1:90-965(+)